MLQSETLGMLQVNRPFFLFAILTGAFNILAPSALSLDIAPSRHVVGEQAPDAYVPYLASHDLAKPNDKITRILFSIHSSGFDAQQYYDNALVAASKVNGARAETLIVAPQFFEQKVIPSAIPDGMLYWRVSPFRGSSLGAIGPDVKKVSLSPFDVMDDWLKSLSQSRQFPQLRDIVVVGHSGGGQFVQRYALVGKFEPAEKVQIRFVVSAPSSYAYPGGERYNARTKKFVVPSDDIIKECPDYNNWGYGMGKPYAYFSKSDIGELVERYAKRHVYYLCGSNDIDPNDDTIGKSCGAMFQGRHRLERMRTFAEFLEFKYGDAVKKTHTFAVVRGVGHYGRGTMTSQQGLLALFAQIE